MKNDLKSYHRYANHTTVHWIHFLNLKKSFKIRLMFLRVQFLQEIIHSLFKWKQIFAKPIVS